MLIKLGVYSTGKALYNAVLCLECFLILCDQLANS
jgi:hypothetical protein